jgi:hypothetical protein
VGKRVPDLLPLFFFQLVLHVVILKSDGVRWGVGSKQDDIGRGAGVVCEVVVREGWCGFGVGERTSACSFASSSAISESVVRTVR